ncbi:DUF1661 domain-containing protein [Porphyromonas gingivalis]|uniref:DUF1661 domain-containing protein n=1 Tax=Porphyromonas gingivalis TaxID=837 RepID=UPI001E5CC409|nr:DUF1661 domain-containing protein [Porphyromonas gingivalis]
MLCHFFISNSRFFIVSPCPPSSRIRLIYALEFSRLLSHKTWCENFSLLVWEAKNSRATTKKFSRHFFQRYCCPVKFLQLLTIRKHLQAFIREKYHMGEFQMPYTV